MAGVRNNELVEVLTSLDVAAQAMAAHSTELAALAGGLALNDVLGTELVVLDPDGIATVNSSVSIASIAVSNFTAGRVTVTAGPAAATSPTVGKGMFVVGAGALVCLPLAGTSHTFYGAAGGLVVVTRWTRPQPPAAGLVEVVTVPLRTTSPDDPAAGAEWSLLTPTNERWELIAVNATFATSAVVADRYPTLTIGISGDLVWRMGAGAQPANDTRTWNAAPGLPNFAGGTAGALPACIGLPPGIVLEPLSFIGSDTTNLDAGDQWSDITLTYRVLP